MKKLLKFLDESLLKFGVAFAILFTALYPKLPSIHIERTWVYIRLEDFVILSLAVIWFIQLLRKKVSLPRPEGYALIGYWIAGLVSLLYCLAFLAPHLQNFFPTIAGFQYVRRIEYMILFFIAFSTVRNVKDVYFYLITLAITVFGISIYGFGQKFYLLLWKAFPDFFQANPFCFPAFLTGNEEFAKGTPMCLTETSRISSTFGGHYDLSAYLVFIVPIFVALFFAVKRWWLKIGILILSILALDVLNFTSSRTSFAAYILGVTGMLILWNKKRWILPVLIVSIAAMSLSSDSTLNRFAKTIQPVQIVTVEKELPSDLKEIIAKTKEVEDNKKPENPPAGTITVGVKDAIATPSSGFTTVLTEAQLKKLSEEDIAISSISGTFLVKKAYALDISFTTRFQAEWPRNWKAFLSSPIFGTGYSSLTLATDNDYLRAIGETGLIGLLSFLFIFVVFGIFMKNIIGSVKDTVVRGFMFGLAGGVLGLLVNALLIDVFEASKVAEPFWILMGIGVGAGYLYKKHAINYRTELWHFFSSRAMILVYFLILCLVAYGGAISNFFVADDFTWLKWAATSQLSDIPQYFINSQDFFYRPLDKTVIYFLYMLFSFQPEGYHIFILLLHFATVVGVYLISRKLFKSKLFGFITAVLFALHPLHHENLFWFSTISVTLSSLFIVYSVLTYLKFREQRSVIWYIVTILLSILAFAAYELSVIIPVLLLATDLFVAKPKWTKKTWLTYVPFILLLIFYFMVRSITHAFAGGGDYSYSVVNLPFNFIGNYLGYLSLYLGGNSVLPLYTLVRDGLREQQILVAVVTLLTAVIIGFILFTSRRKLAKLYKDQTVMLAMFGLVFAAVSLLPFLGLGNVAPRYFYLASVGFTISFVTVLYFLKNYLPRSRNLFVAILVVVSLISVWYIKENHYYAKEWHAAGESVKSTLKTFRMDFESLSGSNKIYFVAAPLRYNETWLYPVGLKDALWFIYREHLPQIYHVDTLEEARNQIPPQTAGDILIFKFDKNGKAIRVQ